MFRFSGVSRNELVRGFVSLLPNSSNTFNFVIGTYNLLLLNGTFTKLCMLLCLGLARWPPNPPGFAIGDARYVRHWLYWQDFIGLFNEDNPGGNVINSDTNQALMSCMIVVGVLTSVKRLVVGLVLGRQTFGKCELQRCPETNNYCVLTSAMS